MPTTRLGRPSHQDRVAEFSGLCKLLSCFYSLERKNGSPLHAITGTGLSFLWGEEQQQAFKEIKVALSEDSALAQPDSEGEFFLDTDAKVWQYQVIFTNGKDPLKTENCDR